MNLPVTLLLLCKLQTCSLIWPTSWHIPGSHPENDCCCFWAHIIHHTKSILICQHKTNALLEVWLELFPLPSFEIPLCPSGKAILIPSRSKGEGHSGLPDLSGQSSLSALLSLCEIGSATLSNCRRPLFSLQLSASLLSCPCLLRSTLPS